MLCLVLTFFLLLPASLSDISCKNAYECAANLVSLEFNESSIIDCSGYRSCIGNTIIKSFNAPIHCSGYESCRHVEESISSDIIYCGSSYSCANSGYLFANNSVVCHGYKSCANIDELTSLSNNALCFGISSCMQSTFKDTKGINCYGLASCMGSVIKLKYDVSVYNDTNMTTGNNTIINNSTINSNITIGNTTTSNDTTTENRRRNLQMDFDISMFNMTDTDNMTVYCYGNLSCAACMIEGYNVESYGRSSLAYSFLHNVDTLVAFGILDLMEATIVHDTTNYSLDMELYGRYSGFNADIWCIGKNVECNIKCLGNACQDLTIYIVNSSNVTVEGCYENNNTNSTQNILCPTINTNITEMFNFSEYENIELNEEFLILYDILDEITIGNNTDWDNITNKICSNFDDCSMEDISSFGTQEILYCMGFKSCDKSNWYNIDITNNIYCSSENSCANAINFVLEVPNLICNGDYSCNSNFTNNISNIDGNIFCSGYKSCDAIINFKDMVLCGSFHSCNGDIMNGNDDSIIYSLSSESIDGKKIENSNELICSGAYSCINKEINNVNIVYGDSIHSLYNSTFLNVSEIYLRSYLSGENIHINTSMDINITCNGYRSCKNANIICNSNNTCNIDCLGAESCLDMIVQCNENSMCNIKCQNYNQISHYQNSNINESYHGYCPYKVNCQEGAECNFKCLVFHNSHMIDSNSTCVNIVHGNGTVNINDTIVKPTDEPTDIPTDIVEDTTIEPTKKPDKGASIQLTANSILLVISGLFSILYL